jgi:hypothetical protein
VGRELNTGATGSVLAFRSSLRALTEDWSLPVGEETTAHGGQLIPAVVGGGGHRIGFVGDDLIAYLVKTGPVPLAPPDVWALGQVLLLGIQVRAGVQEIELCGQGERRQAMKALLVRIGVDQQAYLR